MKTTILVALLLATIATLYGLIASLPQDPAIIMAEAAGQWHAGNYTVTPGHGEDNTTPGQAAYQLFTHPTLAPCWSSAGCPAVFQNIPTNSATNIAAR